MYAARRGAQRRFSVRLICWMALTELLGHMPVLGSFPYPRVSSSSAMCVLRAACNWALSVSLWLWACAYAFAIRARFVAASTHGRPLDEKSSRESYYVMMCVVLPFAASGVAAGVGLYGRRATDGCCTFLDPKWAARAESVLWCSVAFNAFAFWSIHLMVRRTLRATHAAARCALPVQEHMLARAAVEDHSSPADTRACTHSAERLLSRQESDKHAPFLGLTGTHSPEGTSCSSSDWRCSVEAPEAEASRKLRLWPRFALLLGVFVACEAPAAVKHLLWLVGERTPPLLGVIANACSNLHGFGIALCWIPFAHRRHA